MVEITTTLCQRVKDLTFDVVVAAMEHSNISSTIEEEVARFVRENNLAEVPHIFMATHSIGDREWEIEGGCKPIFFNEEGLNGGWFIFREEDVNYLFCAPATSGSSLMAEKQADGTWSLRLEVPIQGIVPTRARTGTLSTRPSASGKRRLPPSRQASSGKAVVVPVFEQHTPCWVRSKPS